MKTPTDKDRREVNRRLRHVGRAFTVRVHSRRVAQWAASEEGPFPTHTDSELIVAEELGILLSALGTLAFVDDTELWS